MPLDSDIKTPENNPDEDSAAIEDLRRSRKNIFINFAKRIDKTQVLWYAIQAR